MDEKKKLPQRDPGATLPVDERTQLIVNREARRIEQEEGDEKS